MGVYLEGSDARSVWPILPMSQDKNDHANWCDNQQRQTVNSIEDNRNNGRKH